MPDTTCHMSISLDGFVAGPDQSRENPLGKRGREVHSWHLGDERANDADATAEGWLMRPRGAYVMGRNMFGPIRGEWDEDWNGWWGSEPPYHAPVFVLTHHAREPIEMEGGTSFSPGLTTQAAARVGCLKIAVNAFIVKYGQCRCRDSERSVADVSGVRRGRVFGGVSRERCSPRDRVGSDA